MEYLHYEWQNIGSEDVIEVTLDRQANVRLMDDSNFRSYHRGGDYKFRGGLQVKSPANLPPPSRGHWHLVIDLDGYVGRVNAGVRLI